MPHPFLSDEWMVEARALRERYAGETPAIPATVRANLVINEVPFGDGKVSAYIDTSAGGLDLELGQLDKPDATLTLDYKTARALLVDGDQAAMMQAFMGGRVKVQGDMAKLMAMGAAGGAAGPVAEELQAQLKAITL